LQALQSAPRLRKVQAVALVVAQAAPAVVRVAPEVALAAARALGPAAQAAVLELALAVQEPAQADPADPVAAASPMSSGADKVPPVLPACVTRPPHLPMAPCRAANGSRFAVF
jgi:hypothetical protein